VTLDSHLLIPFAVLDSVTLRITGRGPYLVLAGKAPSRSFLSHRSNQIGGLCSDECLVLSNRRGRAR